MGIIGELNLIGFSTPKMPENDTHNPKLTELILFLHGGHDLHDLKVNKMNNLSSNLDSAHLKYLNMTPITLYLLS